MGMDPKPDLGMKPYHSQDSERAKRTLPILVLPSGRGPGKEPVDHISSATFSRERHCEYHRIKFRQIIHKEFGL